MEEIKKELQEISKIVTELKEKNKHAYLFEKVVPVLATIFLGIAGTVVSMNQTKISQLQVELQENAHRVDSIHSATQILIQENQNKVNLDRQYIALIYDDIVSGDEVKVNAALKLVKKMRPEVGKAFLEILEERSKPSSESGNSDLEEIQINYSNSLKKEEITIGIHRLRYSNSSRLNEIARTFKTDGYDIIGNFYHENRTSWMATKSTVFYYGNEQSKTRAQKISGFLEDQTGITFQVQKGGGLGVDKARRDFHHFVHIIGN